MQDVLSLQRLAKTNNKKETTGKERGIGMELFTDILLTGGSAAAVAALCGGVKAMCRSTLKRCGEKTPRAAEREE